MNSSSTSPSGIAKWGIGDGAARIGRSAIIVPVRVKFSRMIFYKTQNTSIAGENLQHFLH